MSSYRSMERLSDLQGFVGIRKPGWHDVYATVLMGDGDTAWKRLRYRFLSRHSNGTYHEDIFEKRRHTDYPAAKEREIVSYLNQPIPFELIRLETFVSPDAFGAPPPTWLTWWVNFLHSEETRDTCHFWKRLPYAIFGKPFAVLLLGVFGVICWAFALAGALLFTLVHFPRDINWRWFLWPNLNESPFAKVSGKSAITHVNERQQRKGWRILSFFLPWVQMVFILSAAAAANFSHRMGFAFASDAPSLWLTLYIGLAGLFILWATVWTWTDLPVSSSTKEAYYAELKREAEIERAIAVAELETRYAPLVCDGTGAIAEPPKFTWRNPRPATRHWLQDMKAAYCKQYPES